MPLLTQTSSDRKHSLHPHISPSELLSYHNHSYKLLDTTRVIQLQTLIVRILSKLTPLHHTTLTLNHSIQPVEAFHVTWIKWQAILAVYTSPS